MFSSVDLDKQRGPTRPGGGSSDVPVGKDPKPSNETARKPRDANVGNRSNDPDRASGVGQQVTETTGGHVKNDAERTSQAGYEGGKT